MKGFTEEHEWLEVKDDGVATVGITAYAAKELGDITFIELPETGATFAQGDPMSVIESVKAASDIFCPVGGTVAEVNLTLEDTPEIVNTSPEDRGWIVKLRDIREADFAQLMSEEEYDEFTGA
jgi:glycine cleavage system H protein